MKYLSLQQAMLGMRVTMTDDGLILKSPAGSAHYDLKGRRRTVWGDASFFPEHMRVKDKRKPNLSRVVFEQGGTTIYGPDGKAQIRMGNWEIPDKPKGWRIRDGEVFISNAFISNGMATSDFRVMRNIHDTGKQHAAGMSISIEDGQRKVVLDADRVKVNEAAQSIVRDAVASATKVKIKLSDEMKSAVIDAVRESKQFVENEVANTESAKAEPKDAPAMMAAGYLSVVDSTETDIEKETLSAVLTNVLHGGPEDRFMDTAIQLAKAVKAAFNELNTEDATAN
ncbi:hypothetical protein [Enterobacter asburiae]|uniref:hypothetical protein n=1 Tax=Enterobacter asburiae TaxID=61645 RepID=UPI001CBFF9E6|nr:hypothetical protein [Enterobacter asburiae]UAN38744.1 hypothetical protein KGP18_22960 [Enterobacter asburiae]